MWITPLIPFGQLYIEHVIHCLTLDMDNQYIVKMSILRDNKGIAITVALICHNLTLSKKLTLELVAGLHLSHIEAKQV